MAPLVSLVTQDIHWQVLPEWADVLLSDHGLRMEAWEAAGRVEVVKQGEHRTVHRVEMADRAFHVKHYRCPRWTDVLKNLVRPCAGWREWSKTLEAQRRAIPTITPVAWGRRIRRGLVRDSFFIAETLPGACSLEQFILEGVRPPRGLPQPAVRQAVEGLARFTASVHRAGICHNDFHPGNILICFDLHKPWAGPQLSLIDLPGVRFSGPLDWPATRQNLATLSAACGEAVGDDLQRRFWRAYLEHRPDLHHPGRRAAIEQIQLRASQMRRDNVRRRDRRAWQTNRDYVSLSDALAEVHAVRDVPQGELQRWFADADGPLWENLHRPVRVTKDRVAVEAELPSPDGPIRVIYTRYDASDWKQALGSWFGQSEALRGWYLGHALRARCLPAARPVAVCQPRLGWRRGSGYLATERIDGAVPLELYLRRLAEEHPAFRLRAVDKVAECIGRLLGQMHSTHVYLRRLTAGSILIVQGPNGVETHLADVGEVRIARRAHHSHGLANLAQLAQVAAKWPWIARTAWVRCLLAYLAELPGQTIDWKRLWRQVQARAQRRAGQIEPSGSGQPQQHRPE